MHGENELTKIENGYVISTPLRQKPKNCSIPALPGSRTTPQSIRRRLTMRTPLKTPLNIPIFNQLDFVFEKVKRNYPDNPENHSDESDCKERIPLREISPTNFEVKINKNVSKSKFHCAEILPEKESFHPKIEQESTDPEQILQKLENKMSSLGLDVEYDLEHIDDPSFSSPVATVGSFVDFIDTQTCGPQTPVRRSTRHRKKNTSKIEKEND